MNTDSLIGKTHTAELGRPAFVPPAHTSLAISTEALDRIREGAKLSREHGTPCVTINEDAHGDDSHTPEPEPIYPNEGVAMAATAATNMARAEAVARGEAIGRGNLTTRQKNEIIGALDGVLKNQGDEDEQVQIACLVAVLAARRLLESAAPHAHGQQARGYRIRLARAMARNFESSLRNLVKDM